MNNRLLGWTIIGAISLGNPAFSSTRYTGFYVGATAGYSAYTGNQKLNIQGTQVIQNSEISLKNFGSGSGGLFLGAQKQFESFGNAVVGIEFHYDIFDRARSSTNGDLFINGFKILDYNAKNEIKNNFRGAFKLGKVFDQNKLVYLALGLSAQTVKTSINGSSVNVLGGNRLNFSETKSRSVLTFSPSIGFDMGLTERISVGGEYQFTPKLFRKSLEFTQPFDLVGGALVNHTIRVAPNASRHKIQLRLSYKI